MKSDIIVPPPLFAGMTSGQLHGVLDAHMKNIGAPFPDGTRRLTIATKQSELFLYANIAQYYMIRQIISGEKRAIYSSPYAYKFWVDVVVKKKPMLLSPYTSPDIRYKTFDRILQRIGWRKWRIGSKSSDLENRYFDVERDRKRWGEVFDIAMDRFYIWAQNEQAEWGKFMHSRLRERIYPNIFTLYWQLKLRDIGDTVDVVHGASLEKCSARTWLHHIPLETAFLSSDPNQQETGAWPFSTSQPWAVLYTWLQFSGSGYLPTEKDLTDLMIDYKGVKKPTKIDSRGKEWEISGIHYELKNGGKDITVRYQGVRLDGRINEGIDRSYLFSLSRHETGGYYTEINLPTWDGISSQIRFAMIYIAYLLHYDRELSKDVNN